jgi:hypothetical protein
MNFDSPSFKILHAVGRTFATATAGGTIGISTSGMGEKIIQRIPASTGSNSKKDIQISTARCLSNNEKAQVVNVALRRFITP